MAAAKPGMIAVRTPDASGGSQEVDAEKYQRMKAALLKVAPRGPPGLTLAQLAAAVSPHVPKAHFPDAGKVQWWVKCVQLDLEARGELVRHGTAPMRWSR